MSPKFSYNLWVPPFLIVALLDLRPAALTDTLWAYSMKNSVETCVRLLVSIMPLKNVAVYCCCHCWAPCLQCWNSNPNSLNNPQSPSSLLSLFFLVCCDPFVGGSLLNHECGSLVATWGYYSLHFALELYINRPITCVAPTVRQKTAWSSIVGYHLLRPIDWYIAAISGVDEWYNICCVSFLFIFQ